jgi:hypothetical protein
MNSFGYVTIGAVDGEKSGAFCDAAFGAFASELQFENCGWLGYGGSGPGNKLCVFCSV